MIHSIEFVLGAVSNTASYLRLWALRYVYIVFDVRLDSLDSVLRNTNFAWYHSLAHSELSTVFYEKVLLLAWGWALTPILDILNQFQYDDNNLLWHAIMWQVWQLCDPINRASGFRLCNGFYIAYDGNTERISSRSASSLGGVSEQVLPRRWLQVQTFLLRSIGRGRGLTHNFLHHVSLMYAKWNTTQQPKKARRRDLLEGDIINIATLRFFLLTRIPLV